jgi:hypothetical protein
MDVVTPTRTFTIHVGIKPCECGYFEIGLANLSGWERVPCNGGTTKRTFAPGHDARLKGYLIKAAVRGVSVRRTDANGSRSESAFYWANSFGFGHLVAAGVKIALDKAAAKKPRVANLTKVVVVAPSKPVVHSDPTPVEEALGRIADVARAERMAYEEAPIRNGIADCPSIAKLVKPTGPAKPERKIVRAKVGRHHYDGTIADNGHFVYEDRKGNLKTASKFIVLT